MKIKKDEYEKQLQDKYWEGYWEGISVGINFALDNPQLAEKYRHNIPLLRKVCESAFDWYEKLVKALSNLFKNEEK